jgi:hypothetical protein
VTTTSDADRAAFRWGMLSVALLTMVYLVIAPLAGHPLAMLVLAPLFTAAVGGPRPVIGVGVTASSVAVVVGLLDSGLDATALLARVVVVLLGVAAALWLAALRQRREGALLEASVTVALMDTFQAELAPRITLPSTVSLSARYRPGEERLRLGGDFIDAVELRDGTVAFVVGDVCGHGAGAAALGAAMRNAWRGVVASAPGDVTTWCDAVERAVLTEERELYVTMLTGRIDPAAGRLDLVSAGHPPPVLVTQRAELLVVRPRTPLGIGAVRPVEVRTIVLSPGARLLAYTDGLVENRRPGSGDRWTEEDLVSWADTHPDLDLDELVEGFGPDGFADDVAVLVLSIPSCSAAPQD